MSTPRTYQYYKDAFAGRVMPFAFVDLDLFDQNIAEVVKRARNGKTLRVASKSLRCVPLLERVLAADPIFKGVMAYCAREAVFLSQHGLDDILIAYPVMREAEEPGLAAELGRGKKIIFTVDCVEHVQMLDRFGAETRNVVPLCIDIDLSSDILGFHFGVHRSPLTTPEQVIALCRAIAGCKNVRLEGLLGYEAQISGVPDNAPGKALMNTAIRFLKRRSLPEVRDRRRRIVQAVREAGFSLSFVNGGGTGSVETTSEEGDITEVAVGSAFFSSVLFDWYQAFHHQPSVGYAIEITRKPTSNVFTCHGGGYVASGGGKDKEPSPYLPQGAKLFPLESAGEMQTPLRYEGPEQLSIGDPIFMRYSKAGEMCERFNLLLAVSNGQIVNELPTYRGEGLVFL